jgi:hypothetical protein
MGGALPEWDDSGEYWGNRTKVLDCVDGGDGFLVKLRYWTPLLS